MKVCILSNLNNKFKRNIFKIKNMDIKYQEWIYNKENKSFLLCDKNKNLLNKYEVLNNFDIIIFLDGYIFQTYKEFDIHLLKPKLFYLTHGIHLIYDIEDYKKKYNTNIFEKWINVHKHLKLNYITCCNYLHKNLIYEGIESKYIHKINSLPQFQEDILLFKSNNVELYKDCIIIFICQEEIVKYTKKNLSKIIQLIRKYYTKNKIYFKIKSIKNEYISIYKSYDIEVLNENTNIFDFKKSSLILILEGGTSFLECLQFNPNVILLKLSKSEKYYTFYPIEFNKLLISYDLNTFTDNLEKINNETYFDEEYNKDIKKLIKFHIGVEEISNFEEDFKKNIIYPYLVEKSNNLKKKYNELINKQ